MKIAVLVSRHRRLLALCGLSAAVHLLVLELATRHAPGPEIAPEASPALRLRLAPPARPASAVAAGPERPAPTRPRSASSPAPAPIPNPAPDPAPDPAPAQATAPTATGAAASTPVSASTPESAGTPLVQMPSRYRVRMPDGARLSYTVEREAPGGAATPAGTAAIDWRNDGDRYTLAWDGILGRLGSEGGSSDAGIAPRIAREERGDSILVTEFDADGHRILFHAGGASVPDAVGAQDRASVLMQLAGIGLAEPDQIAGQLQGEIRIVVADAGGAGIARYRVMGKEDVPTALGTLPAWRLAQVAAPGQERIELWLAPGQGWLPVRIRVVRPDGSAATQTLARIEPGAAR